jgi:hypothetical protein
MECLHSLTNQERLGCDVSKLTSPGTWSVLRQLLPCPFLWQPGQPSSKDQEGGAHVLCERLLSKVGHRETGQVDQEHMGDFSPSGLGYSLLSLLA